jgi:RNA polymerase sigma-70 factor (ECF subfamily)
MFTRTWPWPVERNYKVAVTNPTDSDLVAAARAGDREAFGVLVERHRRHVYQLCFRFVGNHEDANDLTQDVFIRAYRSLDRFKGDAALGTWLHRIAVNASLNKVTSGKGRTEPIDALLRSGHPRAAADMESASDALLRDERAAVVRAAIARLPKKQRATLILRVYHDLSHQEIAGILGSSVGAVKANFFHALGNLKKLLS